MNKSKIELQEQSEQRAREAFKEFEDAAGRPNIRYTDFKHLQDILERSEALLNDLKYVRNVVEPCFPPTINIF